VFLHLKLAFASSMWLANGKICSQTFGTARLHQDLVKSHQGVLSIRSMSSLLNTSRASDFADLIKKNFAAEGVEPQDAFPRLRYADLSQCYRVNPAFILQMAPYVRRSQSRSF
jgi:hypothetical protein